MNIDMQKVVTGQAEVTKRLGMSDYTYRRPADLRELVRGSVEADPKKTVFRFRRGDEFLSMSYGEFGRYIDMVGTALYDMGLQGKKIAVMGETSPEWIIAYLAAVCGNCVIVPIDKELPPENVADFINLSGVECLFYSESYAASVDRFCGLVPGVRYFVTMPAESYYPPVSVEAVEQAVGEGDCAFRAVAGRGKYLLKQDVRDYTDCVIDREKMCTLLFTSGTTGTSKGVMLSHKNIVTVAQNVLGSIRVTADEVLMSVLPIHHTYEMSHGILTALNAGCTICINDSLKHLKRNFAEYRPTIMTLVPVFLSSMYKTVWDSAAKSGLDKKLRAGIRVSNAARFVGVDLRAK
ncbi:MAG: AMP-binding protein, partial [Clostridia bacterium]|nr:AMP-binding protein [Clostridia bacterium]